MRKLATLTLLVATAFAVNGQAIRQNDGFRQNSVPRNDDGSSSSQPLGFTINFFGQIRTHTYVNNNGNVTFDSPLATYTPFGLENTSREIIAAFFADVDTRPAGSQLVTFGNDTVNGRNAFGVNYVNVGYFDQRTDKLNSFQIVLIDRSDVGSGNFDIEFNYERIRWETGEASGGVSGLGGVPASVGWSNGTGAPGTSFELEGSLVPGAFLDTGFRSLVRNRLNSTVPGRYIFRARGGRILEPLSISSGCPLPPATAGAPYRAPLFYSGEGTNPRWSLELDEGSTLPTGITFNNGVFSGTPTSTGSSSFTVRLTAATEDGDQTVSKRCSMAVNLARLNITTVCPLPAGTVGQTYSRSFQAAGARGPFTWRLLEGDTAPPGLSLNSNGTLSGVPTTEGNFTFGITVSSELGTPATRYCSAPVQAPRFELSAGSCSLPSATLGVPYTQTLSVRGGTPPYRWRALSALPPGLSLSEVGQIVGIPIELAAMRFGAVATDAGGRTVEQTCSLNVNPASISITTACPLPFGVTGESYDEQFQASGGSAPYTWSQLGSLPAGLRLSPEGRISGRPMAGGGNSFRIMVTDSQGNSGAKACSVPVVRSEFALTSCPVAGLTAGVAFSRNINATGGTPPFIFVPQGQLPAGISLNTFGVLSGTSLRPGTFDFDVRVTDAGGASTVQPCALIVGGSPMSLSSGCPMPAGRVGESYTNSLSVNGGLPPYRFNLLGELPAGLSLNSSGAVSGVPTFASERQFGINVTDSQGRILSLPCSVQIEQPSLPSITLSGVAPEFAPASAGPRVTVNVGRAQALPVRGFVTLNVTPDTGETDSAVDRADPRLRLGNNQLQVPFTLAPGQTSFSTNVITTGTVASIATLTLTDLMVGSTPVPTTAGARQFRVPRLAPVLTAACYATTSEGIDLRVTGYTTTRSLSVARLVVSAPGFPAENILADVGPAAASYFGSEDAVRSGGAFTLNLPIPLEFTPQSVSLILSNRAGSTPSRTLQRCP